MPNRTHLLINIVLFQLGWLGCVLGASIGKPLLGPVCVLVIVLIHLYLVRARLNEIKMMTQVALIGVIWESFMVTTNCLIYLNGQFLNHLPPYWIIAMWFLFATTLNVSLRWLHRRILLASIMGIIFGPITYYGGAKLGGVRLSDPTFSMVVIAISWGVLLPIVTIIARRLDSLKQKS